MNHFVVAEQMSIRKRRFYFQIERHSERKKKRQRQKQVFSTMKMTDSERGRRKRSTNNEKIRSTMKFVIFFFVESIVMEVDIGVVCSVVEQMLPRPLVQFVFDRTILLTYYRFHQQKDSNGSIRS